MSNHYHFDRPTALNAHAEDPDKMYLFDGIAAEALVRLHGGYILGLQAGGSQLLSSPGLNTFTPDEAMPSYAPNEPAKFDATHTMSPVGHMPGQQVSQHGPSRYTPYAAVDFPQDRHLILRARDEARDLTHTKFLNLWATGLVVVDTFVRDPSSGAETQADGLSAGEHFYIPIPEEEIQGITYVNPIGEPREMDLLDLDGQTVQSTFAGIVDDLMTGKAYYLKQPSSGYGIDQFDLTDGRRISVSAGAVATGHTNFETGKLLWHRPGSDTVCIEPVTGIQIDTGSGFRNDRVRLHPGEALELRSGIHVEGVSA